LLVSRAGFAQKPHKIGLIAASAPPPGTIEAFRDGMRQRGYVEGQNFTLDVRTLRGPFEQDSQTAAGLVESGVAIIVAWSTPAALAARRATSTIPIVLVSVSDPIGTGLVRSLARPEGNVTGVANLGRDLSAKQVELFRETVPGLKRIGVVQNQLNPASVGQSREAQAAMRALALAPQIVEASSSATYEDALLRLSQSGVEGVFFAPDPSAIAHRKVIAEQAIARRLPTMFQRRENVQAGGLMSYGADLVDQFRQATGYLERLLKGAKPADLPVEQPTRFEMTINARTAKSLGLTIPPRILQRADDVIE
jgi:putative ABC transport system substrate-binding protein